MEGRHANSTQGRLTQRSSTLATKENKFQGFWRNARLILDLRVATRNHIQGDLYQPSAYTNLEQTTQITRVESIAALSM